MNFFFFISEGLRGAGWGGGGGSSYPVQSHVTCQSVYVGQPGFNYLIIIFTTAPMEILNFDLETIKTYTGPALWTPRPNNA